MNEATINDLLEKNPSVPNKTADGMIVSGKTLHTRGQLLKILYRSRQSGRNQ